MRVTTSERAAATALGRALRGRRGVTHAITLLPEAELAGTGHAIVRVALAPVRRRPDVRAEQVSQEVLGAAVEPLRREGEWLLVRGADGYLGWVHEGTLALDSGREWARRAESEGALVLDGVVRDGAGRPLARLPWGARVWLGDDGEVTLPDGRRGRLDDDAALARVRDRASRFPPQPDALLETAQTWLGVPYLWGGRTRWGADCSGFVQAVFGVHGVRLPRDSDLQAKAGTAVRPGARFRGVRAGDVVFFRGPTSRRVTHVGISLGGARLLHAAEPNGEVAVDDLATTDELGARLAGRVAAVRRVLA